jgi:hypothetical protein
MGASAAEAFGLFVSSVEGQPCSRLGSKVLIGADRDADNPRKIRYRTKEIVAIPRDEATRYAREYARLIQDEALVAHTADEWSNQQAQIREVGAPREKLKSAEPDAATAKDPPHADLEGGRE